jgi:anti-sigma regulatory factor (Ser/Thr protein kinase)
VSLQLELPRDLESAARARHSVDELELPEDLAGDVRLLVSELVTNSLRHAALGPDDEISLTIDIRAAAVRVEVVDRGPHFSFEGRADDPETVEGWGLYLVATLADRWGINRSDDGAGNCVWFELDRTQDLDQAA